MRDFFIGSLEMLINILVVIMGVAVIIAGLGALFTTGFVEGLIILVGGSAYVCFTAGMMYLFLGIYQNTKKTAQLLEDSLYEKE